MTTVNHSPRIHGADALRGIAATCVVLHHLFHLVHKTPMPTLGFISTHFGLGVPLFFCISAFSMYHAYFQRAHLPGFAKAFLVRRYARLLPLFLVLFVLWSLPPFSKLDSISIASLPSYLTMTFAFIPKYSTGYVPAAWSLGVEMIFYLMFPLMILLCRTVKSCIVALLFFTLLTFGMQDTIDKGYSVNVYYDRINPVLFGPSFFAGALIWLKFQSLNLERRVHRKRIFFAIAGVAALFGAWWFSEFISSFFVGRKAIFYAIEVLAFLVAFAILLYGQSAYPSRLFVNSVTRFLGKISYSIYLLHPYVLLIVTVKLSPDLNFYFPAQNYLIFWLEALVTFVVLIPLSMLTYRFVEVPGINLGSRIARKMEHRANLTSYNP